MISVIFPPSWREAASLLISFFCDPSHNANRLLFCDVCVRVIHSGTLFTHFALFCDNFVCVRAQRVSVRVLCVVWQNVSRKTDNTTNTNTDRKQINKQAKQQSSIVIYGENEQANKQINNETKLYIYCYCRYRCAVLLCVVYCYWPVKIDFVFVFVLLCFVSSLA